MVTDCPSCNRKLNVPESLLGQMVKCPTCGATFTASDKGLAPPPPPPDPAAPTERPPAEERPWEEEGPRRRRRMDALPHRGTLILTLGIISIVAGVLGFSTLCSICCVPIPLVGLGLGLTSWILGQGDLKRIASGAMDPEGQGPTNGGRICGMIGTILGGTAILCSVLAVVLSLVFHLSFGGMQGGRPFGQ